MSARSIVRAHRRRLAAGVATAATAAVVAAPASAADFPVLNNGDAGADTLRGQIEAANAAPGPDRITFAANVTGTITLASEITVTDPLTIQGPGAGALTVSGGGTTQILDIDPASAATGVRMPFALSGLTLTDGSAAGTGGAIYGEYVDVAISDAVITGNEAASEGGALYFESARVSIVGTQVTGNESPGSAGAMYVDGDNDNASPPTDTVTITNSTFSGNKAASNAGAIYIDNRTAGDVIITRSTVAGNEASGVGGGVYFYGHMGRSVIRQSTISGNTAGSGGGGVYFDSATDISYTADRSLIVQNSTFTANTASAGGAVFLYDADNVPVEIDNSTIVGNAATTGGGIYRRLFGAEISSTIVAGNTAPADPDLGEFLSAVEAFEVGNSIVGTVGSADVQQNPAGSVQIGVDPQLGPLANNGGPTQTLLPVKTSPAIDKGVANGLTEDQRGLARTGYAGTDIGAVELQPPPTPPDNTVDGARLSGKKTQKQKGKKVVIKVSAGAAEQVDLAASGQIKLGKKKFALKPVKKNVAAGATAKLKLKPKKKSANRKILANPKKGKVSVNVKFTDAAGNETTKKLKLKLK